MIGEYPDTNKDTEVWGKSHQLEAPVAGEDRGPGSQGNWSLGNRTVEQSFRKRTIVISHADLLHLQLI